MNLFDICRKENLTYEELKEGIDKFSFQINRVNEYLENTLMLLCIHNPKLELIKLIIQSDADIKIPSVNPYLFYLFLSEKDFELDVVEYLIELGCDIGYRNGFNNDTILHEIIFDNAFSIKKLEILMKLKPDMINGINIYGSTPLMYLCKNNPDLELIKLMVDFGADVKACNLNNNNCFHFLSIDKRENNNIIQYLIDKGCDIHQKNNKGFNILDFAIRSPGIEKIQRVDLLTKYNLKHCNPSTNENDIFISNFFGFKVAKSFVTYQLYY